MIFQTGIKGTVLFNCYSVDYMKDIEVDDYIPDKIMRIWCCYSLAHLFF
jgi:hypothetical protein